MAFESVRSYVQLASGLGEMTKARAMDAAQGLLALPGADEVSRRAVQVSTLADQLLEAARANRASLVSLVQAEVETALKRAEVARVADLDAARRALGLLGKEVAELRTALATSGAAAVSSAARVPGRAIPRSAAVSTAVRGDGHPGLLDPSSSPSSSPSSAAAPSAPAPAARRRPTARRTPAKRPVSRAATTATAQRASATPKKAGATQKTAAKAAPAKKTTANTTAVKKAAVKKTAAKAAPAKKTAVKKTAAKKAPVKKTTAAARKSTTTKATQ